MDSVMLLDNAHMGEKRPEMKKGRLLANKEIPVSTLLFGDDIEGKIKKT